MIVMKFSIQRLFLLNISSKQTAFNHDEIIINANNKVALILFLHLCLSLIHDQTQNYCIARHSKDARSLSDIVLQFR